MQDDLVLADVTKGPAQWLGYARPMEIKPLTLFRLDWYLPSESRSLTLYARKGSDSGRSKAVRFVPDDSDRQNTPKGHHTQTTLLFGRTFVANVVVATEGISQGPPIPAETSFGGSNPPGASQAQ